MADQDVSISEVNLDSDSMWATEKTLEMMLETIIKLSNASESQKKEMAEGFADMAKTGKATRANLKKTSKSGGGNMFGDTTSGLAGFSEGIIDATDDLDDLGSGPLKKFGKGLVGMTKKMGAMGVVTGAIMNQIGAAISTIKETVDAMRQLNAVGLTVEGDFLGFQEMLKEGAMTIEQMSAIASKYARTVGNVGMRSLVDMTKGAETAGFAFKDYGLTLDEAAEYQAEMLEADRLGGLIKKRDTREQSLMLAENVKTLSAYSKILNVSREDMIKQRVELKGRAEMQRRFNGFDDAKREGVNKSFDQFSDIMGALDAPELAGMITTMLADPAAVASEAFTDLAAAAPEVALAARDIVSKILSAEPITPEDVIDRLLPPLDEAAKSGQADMLSMNSAYKAVTDELHGPVLNNLRNFNERLRPYLDKGMSMEDAISELGKKTSESVKKATEAQTALNAFAATVEEARVKVFDNLLGQEAADIMDSAIGGLRIATEKIDEFGGYDFRGGLEKIVDAFQIYIVEPFRTSMLWLDGTIASIRTGFSSFFTWLKDIPGRIWNAMARVLPITPVELPSELANKDGAAWDAAHPNRPTHEQVYVGAQGKVDTATNALGAALADASTTVEQLAELREMVRLMNANFMELKKQRYASDVEG